MATTGTFRWPRGPRRAAVRATWLPGAYVVSSIYSLDKNAKLHREAVVCNKEPRTTWAHQTTAKSTIVSGRAADFWDRALGGSALRMVGAERALGGDETLTGSATAGGGRADWHRAS